MSAKLEKKKAIDSLAFRNIIGHLTSGVSVITARSNEVNYGLTASAVSSLSLEPPMLLICINQNAGTCHAISQSKLFAVNILHSGQGDVAKCFATPSEDKFKNTDISIGSLGIPLLPDSLVTIECKVVEEMVGGTHKVFLAEVQKATVAVDKEPLVYYRGKFGDFSLFQ